MALPPAGDDEASEEGAIDDEPLDEEPIVDEPIVDEPSEDEPSEDGGDDDGAAGRLERGGITVRWRSARALLIAALVSVARNG